jgi:hypothetical protein
VPVTESRRQAPGRKRLIRVHLLEKYSHTSERGPPEDRSLWNKRRLDAIRRGSGVATGTGGAPGIVASAMSSAKISAFTWLLASSPGRGRGSGHYLAITPQQ